MRFLRLCGGRSLTDYDHFAEVGKKVVKPMMNSEIADLLDEMATNEAVINDCLKDGYEDRDCPFCEAKYRRTGFFDGHPVDESPATAQHSKECPVPRALAAALELRKMGKLQTE